MTRISTILKLALPAILFFTLSAALSGCGTREPVTIVFTGDTQGRLVPAG
jgi:hypothetical protein